MLKGLGRAQANDAGWLLFDGTYVTYPQYKKEWWAYRRSYHAHVRDELVCQTLKEKEPGPIHEGPGRDVEDMSEVWDIFDSYYARPE